jgi:glucosyl-3-phosphoglycerate synthase
MHESAARWFAQATSAWWDWSNISRLISIKRGQRISVVLPARNEQETIGAIVETVRSHFMERASLVDELIVMDSDSVDQTAALAAARGAIVRAVRDVEPQLGRYEGKGEALWKSLFVATGDLLVFIDADLRLWGPHFVTGLIGPLLATPAVELVKGFYDRALSDGHGQSVQGGRVTELVARPILNLGWPELSGLVQPLAGEWAIRRRTFDRLPVPVGYGVELAAILDVLRLRGLHTIAQVDLGERAHTHQQDHDLAVMAAELLAVAWRRADIANRPRLNPTLDQFDRNASPPWTQRNIPLVERPPAFSIPCYQSSMNSL